MHPFPNPHWTRRQALSFLTGTTGALVLHACSAPPKSETTTSSAPTSSTANGNMAAKVGIVTWIGYTPLYIAEEKGFFKEAGLNLELKVFGANSDGNAAFTAGRLDGWAPVTSEAVTLAAKGKDFRIVLVEDNSVGADGILARTSIASIQDFKGKKIAVELGSVSHFFLLQVLKEAGVKSDEVTLVNTTPDAAAAAYQAGKADVAVSYSPFLEKANTAQKDGRIIYDSSKMPTAITDIYIFDTKFVETNPQAVEAFVRAVFKGMAFLKTNEKEGLAIAAKRLNLTPEEVADNLKGIKLPDPPTNAEMLGNPKSDLYFLKSMQALAQFLSDQKQIPAIPPDMAKLLEPKFVKAVAAKS